MTRIVIALLVVAVICSVYAQAPEQQCGPNQVYTSCGSLCRPKCHTPPPVQCGNKACYKGCICKKGYVLKRNGDCVLPEDC